MTKKYCDKCKKATSGEWFAVSYRNPKDEDMLFLNFDFCSKCFASVRTVKDMKKVAKANEKQYNNPNIMKKKKITIEDVFEAVNKGFNNMETRLETTETRLVNKIDAVQESIDNLEAVDVKDLQERMAVAEKDIRTIKRHPKTL